ncbi:glycoside hydrolase family 97 catalytic domain-containing protein [Sphingomonas sp. LR60]|uniref:glycoside hydrolase family 97 catalytic domain-containing protein n=1 Tax=Sphingomonas sp. LR60 TaxID=3050233 RepID=UPI002FE2F57D
MFDRNQRRETLRHYADLGIVGVKVDFPQNPNFYWSTWYQDFARDAAADKLMVDFHGALKPTGTERTWPNVLTREGVRGHEWHITRYHRVLPGEHDTILPFTRYVVGPGDYTPTVFTPRELQGNSWSHELAQAVLFTSPFLSMGGYPPTYLQNPAVDVIKAIPAVWDETIVLPGSEPGTMAGFARRHGKDWFLGVINGTTARPLKIDLRFLGAGDWKLVSLADDPAKPDAFARAERTVRSTGSIDTTLRAQGGFVGWLRPAQ